MPLKNYGVLKGKVVGYTPPDNNDRTPHFTVNVSDNNNREYEIIINVKSKKRPSDLLYYEGENFHSEQITNLPNLNYGFTKITRNNREIALDYIRGNLLDGCKLVPLPVTAPGEDNDLQDKFLNYMKTSANNPKVDMYTYGEEITWNSCCSYEPRKCRKIQSG
ncbi:hypothetical protein ABE23_24550 [Bacillus thuringiensis]|uniref:Uncharacterized protein n=1 Tax=Bacillus thuringiensis T01-328 TaxID=1324966 RepID=A0AAN4KLH3_BACTU|nr:hypothetical protein H175_328p181 [Bacillus thuringiensis serovar thuringiensis str. IS5056]EEM31676.1 hypothetical protein bthur0003_58350 [Bacillus thuringiensis serovar thuringiensis str. T01001]EEM62372.1 hypothetical protein bthur0008_60500 [Bacillus thuringiensis serovar berliner ATCC 10792]ERH96514.1 hypothetical protein BTCBT_007349 [Bacillus thuringiensis T01-328]MBG9620779.1 hypothetical protein [Bacillus thuringiensis]